jgi:CCR4-NOT transcription complex subunit 7/8
VARPIGNFRTSADYHYQTLRCNVDVLRLIQLGITLADEDGNTPEGTTTWQFNFRFSLAYVPLLSKTWVLTSQREDMYAPESVDLLVKSGIDFKRNEEYGIDVEQFGELLISSGLVLIDDVKWISFHSGYDFGYLLKLLTCQRLPADETDFFSLLRTYFPCIYDIKYLMKGCRTLKGGLQEVADDLKVGSFGMTNSSKVKRVGPQHQAGSDALLTSKTFFKMRNVFFEDKIEDKFLGHLFGLGVASSSINANLIPNMSPNGM